MAHMISVGFLYQKHCFTQRMPLDIWGRQLSDSCDLPIRMEGATSAAVEPLALSASIPCLEDTCENPPANRMSCWFSAATRNTRHFCNPLFVDFGGLRVDLSPRHGQAMRSTDAKNATAATMLMLI